MKQTGPAGVISLVCITCGNEHHFDNVVPSALKCEKCSGTVFRQYATPTEPDEATIAQLEEETRSVAMDEASPDSTIGDVRDLDSR